MNAKHTPGPWTRNRAINTVDMGRYSVICPFGADSKKHVSEIEANMRIIAAAPDLYLFVASKAESGDNEALELLERIHGNAKRD